ncbi:Mycolic acid cyclopropane synthase [Macleaya cordata]|uniref:Mycolic acid cyclopropane synthase n=1 Tax=Macleaya cordata TaxID=56857 RepID=A0A200Q217_MACCD|nr:Mycolic acid cyclopropane synthase [Macleaya cordata]
MDALIQVPYNATVRVMLSSLERNLLPDVVIRKLTKMLLASRLRLGYKPSSELQLSDLLQFAHSLEEMPIAIKTDKPKTQHYELPTSFFKFVLGKYMKYSCCYFSDKSKTLEDAEQAMLKLYCERAQIKDGHTVLDIGCGWGSFSLYIAQKYSNCKITGICNSATQKAHIEEQCRSTINEVLKSKDSNDNLVIDGSVGPAYDCVLDVQRDGVIFHKVLDEYGVAHGGT